VNIVDLFCGAGGAAAGYVQAGHVVLGIDINPGLEAVSPGRGRSRASGP
jgi:site-specific DNA-cytosine methylase